MATESSSQAGRSVNRVLSDYYALVGRHISVSVKVPSDAPVVWSAGVVQFQGQLQPEKPRDVDGQRRLAEESLELVATSFRVGASCSFRVELPRFEAAEWIELEGECLVVRMGGWMLLVWRAEPERGGEERRGGLSA